MEGELRRRYNNLTIDAYSSGTTRIADPRGELKRAGGINFRTFYPGGLYGDGSFQISRQLSDWWELQGAQRIVFRNESRPVYEGYISNFQPSLEEGGAISNVRLTGATGKILIPWRIRKRWCDDRISNDIWVYQTGVTYAGAEKCTVDRELRIRFTPKAEAWLADEYAAVRYTMPAGQTVTRVKYDYSLAESAGANDWELYLVRSTTGSLPYTIVSEVAGDTIAGAATTTQITATGSGSIDAELGTPSRVIELRIVSKDNQTPTSDGTYYANFSNIQVFSETSAINMEEIAKDIIGLVTDLNSETRFISAAGSALTLEPFMAEDYETAADILDDAVSQGDAAYNRWGWYCIYSERAFAPDGKPLLVLSQYPATTDYDYAVKTTDPNLALPFEVSQDFDSIANWIVVKYTDYAGAQQYRSPDDTAVLKDDTSIAAYGRRAFVLNLPGITSTDDIADSAGQRYLASYKDPPYRLSSPVVVNEYIRGKGGLIYPSSEIRSALRLGIQDYKTPDSPNGITVVVTATDYDDETEQCALTSGVPEAPLLPHKFKGPTGPGRPRVARPSFR